MKLIAVLLLAFIAAILLFGADSVRSAPERGGWFEPSDPGHNFWCGPNGTITWVADSLTDSALAQKCPLPRRRM